MIMNEWISVHDRLPEIGVRVLVFEKNTVNENMVLQMKKTLKCVEGLLCAQVDG